ncbi:hypothetical protein CHC139_14930 [Helicobacter pylori]
MGQIPLDPPINQNKEISEYSNKQTNKLLKVLDYLKSNGKLFKLKCKKKI